MTDTQVLVINYQPDEKVMRHNGRVYKKIATIRRVLDRQVFTQIEANVLLREIAKLEAKLIGAHMTATWQENKTEGGK